MPGCQPQRQSRLIMRILHVLDHSIPLHSGYTFRTAALVNLLSPSPHYAMAVGIIQHRNMAQLGVSVMRPENLGIVRAGGIP